MAASSPTLIYNNVDSLKATAVTVTSSYGNKLQASNYGAKVVTINASERTNSINIAGNSNNNKIIATKFNDTLTGGEGKDTLTGGEGNDIFIYNSGNDIITDYGTGNDTLKIGTKTVSVTAVETVSSNVIVKTSAGNVTLKGAKGKNINLVDASGKKITLSNGNENAGTANADLIKNSKGNVTINALAGNDSISNSGKNVSIHAGAGNDKITIESGAEKVTIFGGTGADTIYNYGKNNLYQYASGNGNDVIIGYNENDTLHITSGEYSHSVSGNDFIVKVGSNTVKLIGAAGKTVTLKDSKNKIEKVAPDILPEGWKYGTGATIITATVGTAEKNIDLTEDYGAGVQKVDASKLSDVIIIGNNENNSIKTGGGDDELDGGAGNDSLTGGKGNDIFIYTGGDDVITDYGTGEDLIQINIDEVSISAVETVGVNVVFTTNIGTLTVKNGSNKKITVIDQTNNIIYPKKEFPDGWQFDGSKNLLKATVASADNEIDLTEDYGDNVEKVDGSKISGGVKIYGNNLGNSLKGAGNDILDGGSGNDTLTGGTGDDVFIYSGGDDIFTDYTAGKDSIQVDLDDTSGIELETVGSDVIYYTAEGTFKVTKGAGKKIVIMDSNEIEIIPGGAGAKLPDGWQLDTSKNILKATVASADNEIDLTESYGDNVEKVDGSKISGGVKIYGNNLGNSLKGGAGNDILVGGSGNDTLTSGTGDDVFIYSGGDDMMFIFIQAAMTLYKTTRQAQIPFKLILQMLKLRRLKLSALIFFTKQMSAI